MSSSFAVKMASVNFGEKNTWDDWGMVPVERPVIAFPPVKSNIIDLTGADGQIDLLDIIVKAPVYANRTGKLIFRMVNSPGSDSIAKRKNQIAHYLHGVTMDMVLDEEPEYYYTGKFAVDDIEYKGNGAYADITIKYDLEPYKRSMYTTDEQYLWDPFSFEDGIVYEGLIVNAEVSSNSDPVIIDNFDLICKDLTIRPQVVIADNTTNITFKRYQRDTGEWDDPGFVYTTGTDQQPSDGTQSGLQFTRYTSKLSVAGIGKFSLKFRAGAL